MKDIAAAFLIALATTSCIHRAISGDVDELAASAAPEIDPEALRHRLFQKDRQAHQILDLTGPPSSMQCLSLKKTRLQPRQRATTARRSTKIQTTSRELKRGQELKSRQWRRREPLPKPEALARSA